LTRSSESLGTITSRRNPLIRRIARLDRDPAARQKERVYLVWGSKVVEEALQEPSRVETLLVGEKKAGQAAARRLLRQARQASLPVVRVEESLLDDLLPGAGDQGCLAIVRNRVVTLEDLISCRDKPILLVADRVQDPGNLGALLRVGEAAGIAGLVVVPGTVDPYHTRSARASSGSILRLSVARASGPDEFARFCRGRRIRILVTLPSGGVPCHLADLSGSVALVVGNEGEGVSREWSEVADEGVNIPLAGGLQSLNVALASAILLYEAVRQRSV